MKKFLVWFGIVTSCGTYIHADPYDYELSLNSDSRTVALSTSASQPTRILTKAANIERTWIVNTSTYTIYISSASNNLSTSSFGIPGTGASTNPPVIWTPDGTNAPFSGDLYGYSANLATTSISVFRAK